MSGFDTTLAAGPERIDRTGQVLGEKYRLARLIGEGGMGAVYEAQHLVVKRRFAVKLLRPELAKNTEAIARFRREAEAAGALESEHVAAVTDFGEAPDGAPYIVMEYLVGESVAALLEREGPLPVPRAVSILLQVCRGLEVAHDAGIVHRDLKPDNLFVIKRTDGSDLVKILDFGIAKLQGGATGVQVTRTGSAPGTPHYMAPEQARGEKAIDRRTDIYALGVILYELLSGERPHPGDSYNAILAHILTKQPAPLATVRTSDPKARSSSRRASRRSWDARSCRCGRSSSSASRRPDPEPSRRRTRRCARSNARRRSALSHASRSSRSCRSSAWPAFSWLEALARRRRERSPRHHPPRRAKRRLSRRRHRHPSKALG
jgi:serine/threonine-protein kinase